MKIKMLEDCGFCDGQLLLTGKIVELGFRAAQDYIDLGKAVRVDADETISPKPLEDMPKDGEVEAASVEPRANAAKQIGKVRGRKA